jgi:hypothetical protein
VSFWGGDKPELLRESMTCLYYPFATQVNALGVGERVCVQMTDRLDRVVTYGNKPPPGHLSTKHRVPITPRRHALQLSSSRPPRFPKGVKRVEFDFVPLLNVLPADFHCRRETTVLDREELVREV